MLSDSGNGANSATTDSWDTRGQLSQVTGLQNANFGYHPDGRRQQKTVDATTTQFLYSEANIIQELQAGQSLPIC